MNFAFSIQLFLSPKKSNLRFKECSGAWSGEEGGEQAEVGRQEELEPHDENGQDCVGRGLHHSVHGAGPDGSGNGIILKMGKISPIRPVIRSIL